MPTTNSQLLLAVATAATALGGASATQVYLYVVPINSVATSTPSKISYNFSPSALAAADTFTITHDFQRYAADGAVACTLESTIPQVSDSSGTYTCVASGSGTVLTCTLDTGAVVAAVYNTVACTTNIAANPAAGTHTTTMVTTNDATASDPSSVTYTAVVSGKCGGNAVTATNIATASMIDFNYVAEEGYDAVALELDGLFEFDCGEGYQLKASPEGITATGLVAAMKVACCENASVSGKCSGNTATGEFLAQQADDGTFQFQCGTGTTLKSSSATITMKLTSNNMDDFGLNNICCDMDTPDTPSVSGKCSGNTATADFLAQQADDGTFQFQCGTGTTLKSSSATITVVMSRINMEDVGLNNICCDMDTPSVSDTSVTTKTNADGSSTVTTITTNADGTTTTSTSTTKTNTDGSITVTALGADGITTAVTTKTNTDGSSTVTTTTTNADGTTTTSTSTTAATPAPESGDLSAGSSLSVGLAAGVLVTAAACVNLL